VSCVGGLTSVDRLRDAWRRGLPPELDVRDAKGDAVDGAVLLALRADLPHESQLQRHDWSGSDPRPTPPSKEP
jgi:hypothetical protein